MLPVLPKLKNLPEGFSTEGALRLELEEGVPIFRASAAVRSRIQDLLSKQQDTVLSSDGRCCISGSWDSNPPLLKLN
jgi:hypothetical protein